MADQIKTPPAAAPSDPAADALAGTTVGRFAISKRLGAGGMGQVYGAEDTTLKRFVAIKRMAPQALSTDADRKRLLKEAQRASALNHPTLELSTTSSSTPANSGWSWSTSKARPAPPPQTTHFHR